MRALKKTPHVLAPMPAALAVVAGLALAAAGCGSSGGAATSRGDAAGVGGEAVRGQLDKLYQAARKKRENQVVVYGPGEATYAPAYRAFMRRYPGIRVSGEFIFGAELNGRLNAEFGSGRHVGSVQTGGAPVTLLTASQNRCEPYKPITATYLTGEQLVGTGDIFHALVGWAYGIEYNSKQVPQAQAPKGWKDLTAPAWKGKLALEDPTRVTGTTNTITRMLFDGRYTVDWLRGIKANQPLISTNSSIAQQQVASGQKAINVVQYYNQHLKAKQKGLPLAFVFPTAGGSRVEYLYTCLLKDAAAPNAAKLFVNWLFTLEAQAELAKTGVYGLRPGTTPPQGLPPLDSLSAGELKAIPLKQQTPETNKTIAQNKKIFG